MMEFRGFSKRGIPENVDIYLFLYGSRTGFFRLAALYWKQSNGRKEGAK
jgi:hypothetical protein